MSTMRWSYHIPTSLYFLKFYKFLGNESALFGRVQLVLRHGSALIFLLYRKKEDDTKG